MRRFALALIVLCITSLLANGQLQTSVTRSADPFSIRRGSTFTASGGGAGGSAEAKASRVTTDISEAERIIRENFVDSGVVTNDDMTRTALEGALRSLDPHSNYYNALEWQDMLDEEDSGYTGIGASIANFTRGAVTDTYVIATYPGSPAARAQFRFGDKIVAINGEKMTGLSSDDVRDKIRGGVGSIIRMTIERASDLRTQTLELRRAHVPQPSIPDAYVIHPGVGYIQLSDGFNYTTNDEFGVALRALKQQNIRSLILDLRGNGGGIVAQAVKVAERFLPAGSLILTQEGRSRFDNRVWRSSNVAPETMPLVVLVDQDTASASEIVAAALQDNDRALIVGSRTFGKGLVQSVIDLPFKTGLTLTTARYLTPSGRSLQRDYTKLDNYDYYEHKTPAAAVDKPMVATRTLTARTVFGGDGITPDDEVKLSDDTVGFLNDLADPLFFYVRDAVNGRSSGGAFRNVSMITGTDATVDFIGFVKTEPAWRRTAKMALAESELVRSRLRYELTLATAGASEAARVLMADDPQVAKAVDEVPRSADLARSADRVRRSRLP